MICILVVFTAIYGYMAWNINKYSNEPKIRSRSPLLLMMITIACYLDTTFKLFILGLSYKFVDLKCSLAIGGRVVNHYMAFIFIIIRIRRMHTVNEL